MNNRMNVLGSSDFHWIMSGTNLVLRVRSHVVHGQSCQNPLQLPTSVAWLRVVQTYLCICVYIQTCLMYMITRVWQPQFVGTHVVSSHSFHLETTHRPALLMLLDARGVPSWSTERSTWESNGESALLKLEVGNARVVLDWCQGQQTLWEHETYHLVTTKHHTAYVRFAQCVYDCGLSKCHSWVITYLKPWLVSNPPHRADCDARQPWNTNVDASICFQPSQINWNQGMQRNQPWSCADRPTSGCDQQPQLQSKFGFKIQVHSGSCNTWRACVPTISNLVDRQRWGIMIWSYVHNDMSSGFAIGLPIVNIRRKNRVFSISRMVSVKLGGLTPSRCAVWALLFETKVSEALPTFHFSSQLRLAACRLVLIPHVDQIID